MAATQCQRCRNVCGWLAALTCPWAFPQQTCKWESEIVSLRNAMIGLLPDVGSLHPATKLHKDTAEEHSVRMRVPDAP